MQRNVEHARLPQIRTGAEKRREMRTHVRLKGKLFVPQRNCDDECTVLDFSTHGAGLKCAGFAPIGTRIVLYVDGFGRFDGIVVRRDRTRLGIEFLSSQVKRERTRDQLAEFVTSGMMIRPPSRLGVRVTEVPTLDHFVAEDGARMDCKLIDIALGGASLSTEARPEIGTTLAFGKTAARVVRHTANGIAVEFIGHPDRSAN